MKKEYVPFDPQISGGYPRDTTLYFECGKCGELIPSDPKESVYCKCYNIMIDVDAGRISVKRLEKMRLVRMVSEE